jgi:hypothetical protein
LSDPEQADVPPHALWLMIVTSTPLRFISTAARRPAAPLPTTTQPLTWTGTVKPLISTHADAAFSGFSFGISTSVRASRIACDTLALTCEFLLRISPASSGARSAMQLERSISSLVRLPLKVNRMWVLQTVFIHCPSLFLQVL